MRCIGIFRYICKCASPTMPGARGQCTRFERWPFCYQVVTVYRGRRAHCRPARMYTHCSNTYAVAESFLCRVNQDTAQERYVGAHTYPLLLAEHAVLLVRGWFVPYCKSALHKHLYHYKAVSLGGALAKGRAGDRGTRQKERVPVNDLDKEETALCGKTPAPRLRIAPPPPLPASQCKCKGNSSA